MHFNANIQQKHLAMGRTQGLHHVLLLSTDGDQELLSQVWMYKNSSIAVRVLKWPKIGFFLFLTVDLDNFVTNRLSIYLCLALSVTVQCVIAGVGNKLVKQSNQFC